MAHPREGGRRGGCHPRLGCAPTFWNLKKSSNIIINSVNIGIFLDIKSFRSHYGPGVDSVSNRNDYQEHFLGVKAADVYG